MGKFLLTCGLTGLVGLASGVEIDVWSRRERHPAVVNAVTAERDGFTLSLRGEWDFKPIERIGTRFPAHTNEFFWAEGVSKIKVPGCWEAQGVGTAATSTPWAVFWDSSPAPYRHVFRGWAWYRKTFEVPAEWKGRRIWLKIGGVASEGTFTVNGRSVARINPYCGTWKYEITDLVRLGGTNVVAAVVSNRTPSRRGCSLSSNHWGGLWRDVEIEATPSECFIDDAWVRGDFDRQEAEAHVEIGGQRTEDSGQRTKVGGLRLRVTIEGETVAQTIEQSNIPNIRTLKVPLRNFRAWSPEHPNLYTARVELVSNGRVVQTRRERFGVRKLETRGNEFYLNGRPFFVRGAGYHHIYPLTGIPPADDQDELRRRVRKIRATGFNYVRLHTRCEIPEFFEVCDEEGLMVEPELPYYHSLQCDGLAFDPFADAKELYENFRRYPSFVAYSGGNEGDFDEACARDLYREIRTRDPDRLMIAQDGSKDFRKRGFTDFQSGPFTAWPRGAFRSELPFVAHEYMNQCVKFDSRASEKFMGVRPPPISRQERADWLARFGLDLARGDRLQEGQNAIQRYWHKYGIEAARADPYCSGYSFWSLQDACSPQLGTYSGQAIYDPFFDDKRGGSTAESFRVFNGPVALLFDTETGVRDFGGVDPRRVGKVDRMLDCDMDDFDLYVEGTNRVYVSGEPIAAKFLLSHYGERDFAAAKLAWKLTADGETLASGTKDLGLQRVGRVCKVFEEPIAAPDVAKGVRAEMSVTLTDGGREVAANSWPLYVLPKRGVVSHPDVAVAPSLARRFAGRFAFASDLAAAKTVIAPHGSPEAKAALAAGKNLVTLANQEGPSNIRLGWWWMGSQMGMAFEPSPVFAELPQETSLTPLYMRLVKEGTPLPLADFRTEDLVVYGEGGEKCYAYLAIRTLPQGGRHAFVSGLDLLSDLPEGTALLEGILKAVSGSGRLVVDLPVSPVCKIGFLTDTHLRPGADEINDRTRKAFEVFKAQGVDAIGHCGDLADLHYPEMYDLYRSFIEKTYPDETKRPQLLYVYANHDLIDVAKLKAGVKGNARQMPFEEGFRDMKSRLGIGHWLFHSTEVKGVPVVVLPQIFEYEGGIARVERMLEEACAAHPTGPIVVLSHLAPAGTVYGSERWGYWNYRQVLEKFPRVISFSGHTHNSLRNPASFWQGAFSAVDVGCLEWWYGREEDGCDGGFACRVKSAYGVPIAEFYPDRVVIRRYDVRDGSEMDADAPWTVRQPYAGRPSGIRGGRVPRFADGAKLSVAERGDKVVLTFPPAEREDDVLSYRIEASVREGDGWHTLVKGGCYSQFYLCPSERKDVCVREIARNAFQNELTYRFTVTPVGADGTEGSALQADLTTR